MPLQVVEGPIQKEKIARVPRELKSGDVTDEQFRIAQLRGITKPTVKARIDISDYTIEEAISIPTNGKRRVSPAADVFTDEDYVAAFKNGVSRTTVRRRFRDGYTKEQCIAKMPVDRSGPRTVKYDTYQHQVKGRLKAEKQVTLLEENLDKLMEALDYYAARDNGEVATKALESIK